MISNTNKNVICVKDIPSNIIEEAIFILKSDVNDDFADIRKEIARDEAEEFVGDYVINIEKLHEENCKKKSKIDSKFALEILGVVAVCAVLFFIFI